MLDVRWALSGAFAVVGGYCLLRCVLPAHPGSRWPGWVSDAAHVAMSAAMTAMVWGSDSGDRWGAQLTVFAAAAAWFFVRAVACHAGRDRVALVHQGVAMAAMFWMLLVMAPTSAPGGMVVSGRAMAGMVMPAPAHPGAPGQVVTAVLTGYLAVATLWWLRTAVAVAVSRGQTGPLAGGQARGLERPRSFGPASDAGCQALMAAAMCAALLVH